MEQSSMTTVYPSPFLTLPSELGVKILSLVDQKTLLIFEQVSKSVAGYVNATWHEHKGLGLKFSWSDCQKEHCPEKWELILSRALIRYIESQTSLNKNPKFYSPLFDSELLSKAKLQQISLNYFKLKRLTERFPSFGAYIRLDLAKNIYANGYLPVHESNSELRDEIFEINPELQNEEFGINKERHDSLMKQVLEICAVDTDLQTYVSAYLLARFKQPEDHSQFINDPYNVLGLCKKSPVEKNLHTLQNILSNPQNLSDFNRVPANLLNDLKQKNTICKIPSEHGGELLLRALFKISKVKVYKKETLKKVNQYFLDAIQKQATYASQLAFNLIYDNRHCLLENKHGNYMSTKTLALFYEPLAISSAEQGDFNSLVNLADLKFRAGKSAEAESFYENYLEKVANQCIDGIDGIDLLEILYVLTNIKVKLKKFKEVELPEIHTLLLKLNQAWMNMMNNRVLVVYKKEMKDLSAEEFFKEFEIFFFHPKEKLKKIVKSGVCFHPRINLRISRIRFLSDLLLAAQMSGKWKKEEIILAIEKMAERCSPRVNKKIQLQIKAMEEMEKIQNKEPQSTEKELQEPVSKRARYN